MFGAVLFIPLFVQGVVGLSATEAGAVLTPMMLSVVAGSVVAGQLIARTGRYRWVALLGLVVLTVGSALMSRVDASTSSGTVLRNGLLLGFGLGVTLPLYTIVVQNAFPMERLGTVTSAIQFFRSIGGTIGVAVMGTVMVDRMGRYLVDDLAQRLPPSAAQLLPADGLRIAAMRSEALLRSDALVELASQLPPGLGSFSEIVLASLRASLARSIADVFLLATAMALVSLAATAFLKEVPLRRRSRFSAPPEGEAAAGPTESPTVGGARGRADTSP
jgi:MFS family permease